MPNTLLTSKIVAMDAAIILSKNLISTNLVGRNYENQFADRIGSYIDIKVPPIFTARDLVVDVTTQDSAVTETAARLQLTKTPYLRVTLTSAQKKLELTDFNRIITEPAVNCIRDDIDQLVILEGARGFAQYLSGTAGTEPSTLAHLAAGIKVLNNNGCPQELRRAIVGTNPHAALVQISQFTSSDYGTGRPDGLREATLGKLFGVDFFMDQNAGAELDDGAVAAATNVYGTQAISLTTLNVDDGAASSTGTIKEGARFTIAGNATVYTVLADSTAAAGAFALSLDKGLAAQATDNAAITWIDEIKENLLFHREAIQAAVVAPEPLSTGNSAVGSYDGINIRVSMDGSISTMSDTIVFDTFAGARCVQRKGGCILCG